MRINTFVNSTEDIGLTPPTVISRSAAGYTWEEISSVPNFNYKAFSNIFCLDLEYTAAEDEKSAAITKYSITHLSGYTHRGTCLDGLFAWLSNTLCGNIAIGVYNLGFYGYYILNYLLSHGIKAKKTAYGLRVGEAFFMISDEAKHMYYTFKPHSDLQITFIDLKANFRLKPDELRAEYDCVPDEPWSSCLMRALVSNFRNGLYYYTCSVNAMSQFKKSISNKLYDTLYSGEYTTRMAREAFYGGYCWCNPKYQQTELHDIYCYDINSMYPDAMLHAPLPFGDGAYYRGDVSKYAGRDRLYIQHLRVCYILRDGAVPAMYRDRLNLSGKAHPSSSAGETRELYLTNWDMQLLKDNYIIVSIEYIDGFIYAYNTGHYNEDEALDGAGSNFFAYVQKYRKIKETSKGPDAVIAKAMLNTLFGALGRRTEMGRVMPVLELDEKGSGLILFEKYDPPEDEPPIVPRYTELACFIAAWARYRLIQDIKSHLDTFIYCDTDSLYLSAPAPDLKLDEHKFGYYKLDKQIDRMYVVGCKRYIWEGYLTGDPAKKCCIACSGATPAITAQMNFDNFKVGACFIDNELSTQVKGGIIKKGYPFLLTEDTL